MPIQFPLPERGNPFDRWKWQVRPRLNPLQQKNPNLGHVGMPFNASKLAPGLPRPDSIGKNVRNLGKMYQHGERSGAMPNPIVKITNDVPHRRVQGSLRMVISGVSRDSVGATLGSCRVMLFRTTDRAFISETTSDGSGNWSMEVLVSGPFFLVEYKSGSPDVAGTSKNNLDTVPL